MYTCPALGLRGHGNEPFEGMSVPELLHCVHTERTTLHDSIPINIYLQKQKTMSKYSV